MDYFLFQSISQRINFRNKAIIVAAPTAKINPIKPTSVIIMTELPIPMIASNTIPIVLFIVMFSILNTASNHCPNAF